MLTLSSGLLNILTLSLVKTFTMVIFEHVDTVGEQCHVVAKVVVRLRDLVMHCDLKETQLPLKRFHLDAVVPKHLHDVSRLRWLQRLGQRRWMLWHFTIWIG